MKSSYGSKTLLTYEVGTRGEKMLSLLLVFFLNKSKLPLALITDLYVYHLECRTNA